ncbi:hypothetical protein PC9H_009819 [Pleurotus ostreatus]|uniref:Uncharacterized protein n=1 Tax=Pleurotus ostreatus TaxID=5322 RepID=A0A8H7DPZ3_PLEOS|nr:uncharacterized protein PC9H_009819 [Pleurotus ostreatus]KAF7424512.1 hypothetical protein PC9H_009819 [Pleurotus ostreatus]KAJ8692537.1 hypothetical protein PTI98_009841 [Pleurotus ostreatus]
MVATTSPRPTVDVPRDVWLHIAQFVLDDDIRDKLLSFNSTFHDLSMRLRYETVTITEFNDETTWRLNRLRDPAVGWRVRTLTLRPNYRIRPPRQAPAEEPNTLRHIVNRVTGFAQRHFPNPAPEATGIQQTTALLVQILPYLTNVVDFQVDAWNLPPTAIDLGGFASAACSAFGKGLKSISLAGYPSILKEVVSSMPDLPSLDGLSLDFTNDIYSPDSSRDHELLVDSILPFVKQVAPQLRSLSVTSWTNLDFSELFARIGPFPRLESFATRAIFDQALATSTDGLTRLLVDSSATLKHVQLKLRPAKEGEPQLANWLCGAVDHHPTMLTNLKTLQLYPTTLSHGFDAAKQLIHRSSSTMTNLTIRDRYLSFGELEDILGGEATRIKKIQICVHTLSVRLLDLLANRCPELRHLILYVGRLGGCNDDGQEYSDPVGIFDTGPKNSFDSHLS